MSLAHQRPKQPEQVRARLLACAAQLAAERGATQVTVQAVAEAAGVTKGGLFHHFPNRQALMDAVYQDMLDQLDQVIDQHLQAEAGQHGCFTRAYIKALFAEAQRASHLPWLVLSTAMVTDPIRRAQWSDWLATRLAKHQDTDQDPQLAVARLAADGAWLAFSAPKELDLLEPTDVLAARLIALTYPSA